MKKLFLTRAQARDLAEDLLEYSQMQDSNMRDVVEGFEIRFGDQFGTGLQKGKELGVHPIPNCLLIEDEIDP